MDFNQQAKCLNKKQLKTVSVLIDQLIN